MVRKHRRFILKSTYIILLVSLGLAIIVVFYFKRTNAPITEGQVILEQQYKDNLKLDIYLPTHSKLEKSPTVLFIHGGAWMAGTKRSINFNRFNQAINQLRAEGFTIISPQYTLATKDQSPFPDCVEDIFTAAHWVYVNADKYNLDPEKFGVLGESAGAHLALMLAYADPVDFDLELKIPQVKYVVDVYGPTDLYALYTSSTVDSLNQFIEKLPGKLSQRMDLSRRLFGFDPKLDSAKTEMFTRKFSPVTYLVDYSPPTLIIHGQKDQLVPVEQSSILANMLESSGSTYEFHTIPEVNHGFIGANDEQKAWIQDRVLEFIMKYTN